MASGGMRMGSAGTALQKSSQTMSSDAAKMMHGSIVSESVKTEASVGPTVSEIAKVAYQLWLDNGCPGGSDLEDWSRAEAMLKNALVVRCEDLSSLQSIPRCDPRIESEVLWEFRWNGHWEVWEMEWSEARWIWD
jgi:hypothetical protein